ncbi:hypothetical protein [Actinoplanes sp. GCM10030250]
MLSTPGRGTIANEVNGSAALSATSAWAVGAQQDATSGRSTFIAFQVV